MTTTSPQPAPSPTASPPGTESPHTPLATTATTPRTHNITISATAKPSPALNANANANTNVNRLKATTSRSSYFDRDCPVLTSPLGCDPIPGDKVSDYFHTIGRAGRAGRSSSSSSGAGRVPSIASTTSEAMAAGTAGDQPTSPTPRPHGISDATLIESPTAATPEGAQGKGEVAAAGEGEKAIQKATPPNIPDGGFRAWLVVAGSCHVFFATFGFVNSWGVFQEYYATSLFTGQTSEQIAWIGSLQYLGLLFPGLFMGRLLDTGKWRIPFYVAALICPISLILAAQVKEYWQAILSHGILYGVTGGISFTLSITVLGHWFREKRALAIGIVAAVGSVGGVIYPILVKGCLEHVGFRWTLRICGFVNIYLMAFGVLTIRSNIPPHEVTGGLINPAAFKSPSFSLYCIAAFTIFAGLYTPLSYISVSGRQVGLGDFSVYLVSIANAGSVIGRLLPAFFADRVGPVNLIIPALLGSIATTFAWPFARSQGGLIAVAVINGFFQGSFVSLAPAGVARMGELSDIGRRVGTLFSVAALGTLIGPPISGAILAKASFHEVSYYAGFMVVVGFFSLIASRYSYLGGWKGKM